MVCAGSEVAKNRVVGWLGKRFRFLNGGAIVSLPGAANGGFGRDRSVVHIAPAGQLEFKATQSDISRNTPDIAAKN